MFHQVTDEKLYTALAKKIRNAINLKYLDTSTGIYDKGYQTELSVPLYWNVVPDDLRAKVATRLAERVKADNYHLDAGILGAKAILGALSDNGYADVAYQVAAQETYPSWGWWILNGATTLYENWNIDAKSDLSLNHIMFGEIGAWLYKGLGGIKIDTASPGFKHIIVEPYFPANLAGFSCSHDGPFGKIVSGWKTTGHSLIYNITIPPNSTAVLKLPSMGNKKVYRDNKLLANTQAIQLEAGSYAFVIK